MPTSDERTMSMLAHLLGIVGWFVPALIVRLTKGNESPWVKEQSTEALNFQITVALGYAVSALLVVVLVGLVMLPAVWVASVVLSLLAAMKSNEGEPYRYPYAIRVVKP
ncbi:MAG TPA: DUF4870 domain-containing protein [Acidimicrobiales bacterium]|nr:DUF4870 domain-containing protein [Acidimicrobiales bacterium]